MFSHYFYKFFLPVECFRFSQKGASHTPYFWSLLFFAHVLKETPPASPGAPRNEAGIDSSACTRPTGLVFLDILCHAQQRLPVELVDPPQVNILPFEQILSSSEQNVNNLIPARIVDVPDSDNRPLI